MFGKDLTYIKSYRPWPVKDSRLFVPICVNTLACVHRLVATERHLCETEQQHPVPKASASASSTDAKHLPAEVAWVLMWRCGEWLEVSVGSLPQSGGLREITNPAHHSLSLYLNYIIVIEKKLMWQLGSPQTCYSGKKAKWFVWGLVMFFLHWHTSMTDVMPHLKCTLLNGTCSF